MNNWNDGDGEMKTTGGSHLKNNDGGIGQKHGHDENCHNRSGNQKVQMNWAGLWCAPGALVNIVAPIQKGLDPTHHVHNLLENCRGSRCRVVVNPYNTFQVGNLNGVTIQSNLGDRVHIPQCCFLRSTLPLHTLTKKNKMGDNNLPVFSNWSVAMFTFSDDHIQFRIHCGEPIVEACHLL